MALPAKKITAWSFSRYNDYTGCPAKAKYKHVMKIKEPGSPAMDRGSAIGKLLEDYIRGNLRTMPKDLKDLAGFKKFEGEFKKLRKLYAARQKSPAKANPVVVEDNWAFTREWGQTRWDDWTGCWLRVKIDVAHFEEEDLLIITDWKTGKFRDEKNAEYMEQLDLYLLSALLMFGQGRPSLRVRARLAYLDEGRVFPEPDDWKEYTIADLPKLKKAWEARTKKMLADTVFKPTPGNACLWCHYRAANASSGGGQCKF